MMNLTLPKSMSLKSSATTMARDAGVGKMIEICSGLGDSIDQCIVQVPFCKFLLLIQPGMAQTRSASSTIFDGFHCWQTDVIGGDE